MNLPRSLMETNKSDGGNNLGKRPLLLLYDDRTVKTGMVIRQ